MIIDSHAHTFPRLGSDSEDQPGAMQLKFIQHHIQFHKQGWRRVSDGARSAPDLLRPRGDSFDEMPDVNLRVGRFGRIECTVEGVDYFMQWYPCALHDCSVPPELMISYMDYMGVDMGVLQHDHVYGSLNRHFSDIARRFPGRFLPLAQIREWQADQISELNRLEEAITELGLRGLYFAVEAFGFDGWRLQLDDPRLDPLWTLVERLKVPVFWYLYTSQLDRFAGYIEQAERLTRWARRYPGIQSVITHGIETMNFRTDQDRFEVPDIFIECLKHEGMHLEVMFHLMAPDTDFPYAWAQPAIRRLYDELGPSKLVWGSDMPAAERSVTYKQSMDYVRNYCDFLTSEDLSLFFGGNVARIMGDPQTVR